MNRLLPLFLVFLFAALSCEAPSSQVEVQQETFAPNNMAYRWGKMALTATANDTERFAPRPTITSRYLGLIFTAVYDAWTRYDSKADPMYLSGVDRRPNGEHTLSNKEVAISYAAYHTLNEYYTSDTVLFRNYMIELGLDPDDNSVDPTTAVGIGNLAAQAVISARHNDGANQYGEAEGSEGRPYFDYTGYQPINSPDQNTDINRWQPKYFEDMKGNSFAPGCLTPHWHLVKPLALDSAGQFRPGPPPLMGSDQLAEEVREVVEMQTGLTPEEKALVEFMRDGPKSVQQAGHWLIFAQDISLRDKHTLDQDVKMYFLNQMTAMDAFIASWDSKMYYDFARPYALVHELYKDSIITGWAGPEEGWKTIDGEEWRPYSPSSFLCPPFPSYTSGHSTVSGACAEALRHFTGSDEFGASVKRVPGALTEPDNLGDTVTLYFPTFTEAAEMAGISRVLGGYHIQADNIAGLELGRDVARAAWEKYQMLVNGQPNN